MPESPNTSIMPQTAKVDSSGHLNIGGCDTVELAKRFGTPLWIMDEETILQAGRALKEGLSVYPNARGLYAGKAFLCMAMCHLVRKMGMGLDVVSDGEMYTAEKAGFPKDLIYVHGNNKSEHEIRKAIASNGPKIVIDSVSELEMCARLAAELNARAKVLIRVIPDVEPDTHHHIVTGHATSKFGVPLDELDGVLELAKAKSEHIELLGLHAHIGSQSKELEPFLETVDILANLYKDAKEKHGLEFPLLDVGGGLGITYIEADKPAPIYEWARQVAEQALSAFKARNLTLPELLVEPGRSVIGPAGTTIYTVGHTKKLPDGTDYIAVDGGMADNPRPITYGAKYTPAVANRMNSAATKTPAAIVGRYCESGDIIVEEAYLSAQTGDLIAVFATGAYNYSMASNYNRTGRPACVLVSEGQAEIIIERENNDDLISKDRVPNRLKD